MIDNFSLLISHGLLALLFWRLLTRPDLDKESPASPPAAPAPATRSGKPAARGAAERPEPADA